MGWVTMTVAASVYYVVPKIYGTTIFSEKVANVHFWLVLVGQLIFSVTMWITGIQQGAMWKAMENGKLKYTFVEGLARNYPYYHMLIAPSRDEVVAAYAAGRPWTRSSCSGRARRSRTASSR